MGSRSPGGNELSGWEEHKVLGWGWVLKGTGHFKGAPCWREEVWFPGCHYRMPFPLQVPDATKQDTVAAALEWQRKLEAAEALLALKNSSQVPPDSASLQQRASMPGSCLL